MTETEKSGKADVNEAQPIFVRLVGGDDLKPFEQQSLRIARKTYWVTFFGLLAAVAAAVFVGVQVSEMTRQTQILASQTEGANASSLMDEMNTRKQLFIAQKQMEALQDQVVTMRHNFNAEQRPFMWITNDNASIGWDKAVGAFWTFHYTNYGKATASYVIDHFLLIGPDALNNVTKHKMPSLRGAKETATSKLPQGKTDYITATFFVPQEFFDEALKHDNWIVVAGTFVYYDLAGNLYTTDFCSGHLASNAISICKYKHQPPED